MKEKFDFDNWWQSFSNKYQPMSIDEFKNEVLPYETMDVFYTYVEQYVKEKKIDLKDIDTLINILKIGKLQLSKPQHDKDKTKVANKITAEYLQNLIEYLELQKSRNPNISIPPEGLKSIYDAEKLNLIFDRLHKLRIVESGDRTEFLALFTDKPIGLVYWNNRIYGAQAGLFDLMARITGKEMRAAELKLRFRADVLIHDKSKDKAGKPSKLIDKIMEGI